MKLEMDARKNVRSLFATPVAGFLLPNARQINPGLLKLVLDMEQAEGAQASPPINGWHSAPLLAESNHPDVRELLDSMRSGVLNMVSIMSKTSQFKVNQHFKAWASVYRSRSHGKSEVPSESSWSGSYFIQAARLGKEQSEQAGKFSFHDPRSRVGMVSQLGKEEKSSFEINPRDGLMLIYPSWLQCQLNAFISDTSVLTISFNSRLRKFEKVA
jgi:hypothetical protein